MNYQRLINAINKITNNKAKIEKMEWSTNGGMVVTHDVIINGKPETRKLCFYAQSFDGKMEAVAVHTPSKHTDMMTDCYCDISHRTIKAAANWLVPSGAQK